MVVYGGTSAAVMSAVQAARMGRSVVLVCPDRHLGGLSSGGLGYTDSGNKAVVGGLAREFYHRVHRHYEDPVAWKWQTKESWGTKGRGAPAVDGNRPTLWLFEPHVAEHVFEGFIRERVIQVVRGRHLDRKGGVQRDGKRIVSLTMTSGERFTGRQFIDATYEGDLLAAAGVSYHVGREGNQKYGETWNGVQPNARHHRHRFSILSRPVSPYRIAGEPTSGLLREVHRGPPGRVGEPDSRVQAYCFRLCLTDHPDNRVPFAKPASYDADRYELLARVFETGWREMFQKFDAIPNRKTDVNNHGPFSSDYIGGSDAYPEASDDERQKILAEHRTYQEGLFYFMANDSKVPVDVRKQVSQWGLAKDEFVDNGHWPHQIYVREARRMVGEHVVTEHDLFKTRPVPDPVGMGSYALDSHHVQRYVTDDGAVENEGDLGISTKGPYAVSARALMPNRSQIENLLVPVCVSSSHAAYGSIRMEPVFMILGQSAATIAVLALERGTSVQEVPYPIVRQRLLADGQILEFKPSVISDGGRPKSARRK